MIQWTPRRVYWFKCCMLTKKIIWPFQIAYIRYNYIPVGYMSFQTFSAVSYICAESYMFEQLKGRK